MVDLEKNYIDLAQWFEKRTSYCDWEGFADPKQCLNLLKKVLGPSWVAQTEDDRIVFTLTLHFVYTRTDSYELPNEEEVRAVWEAFTELLGSRWWMKEDV